MANKIIGRTDTSGAVSLGGVSANSKRPILLVGVGADTTKEVLFDIAGTADAKTHFGATSPFVDIVKLLVRNGVQMIKGINVGEYGDGKTYADITEAYDAAYAKSLEDKDIMIIILDCTTPAAYTNLPTHLVAAENADIFRYAVIGAPTATVTTTAAKTLATGINSDRVFVPFPNLVDDSGATMDGMYAAAVLAAILNTKTDDPALPTNTIQALGTSGIASKFLQADVDSLTDGGLTVFVDDGGIPTTWRTTTTAQKSSGVESIWHDATTRLIADDVLNTVLSKLKANYKRTKNIARVLESIRGDIIAILDNKLALEIIEEYDESLVTVVKDPNDRYGALADFEYKVVSPLYTITVTQHIKI